MKALIYHWQGLIGSLIGAATPFLLFWFSEKYRLYREKKERLYYFERVLVDRINNLHDTKRTIQTFLDVRLSQLISDIDLLHDDKTFAMNWAFFPLFSIEPIETDVFRLNTGSGYLDNKIGNVYRLSKDFALIVDDMRQQFRHTIDTNQTMILSKLPNPSHQKESYKENLKEFRKVAQRDLVETNIRIYMKVLIETRVSLTYLSENGYFAWRRKFDPRYKFFMNKKRFVEATKKTYDLIELFFKEEVEKELTRIGYL